MIDISKLIQRINFLAINGENSKNEGVSLFTKLIRFRMNLNDSHNR